MCRSAVAATRQLGVRLPLLTNSCSMPAGCNKLQSLSGSAARWRSHTRVVVAAAGTDAAAAGGEPFTITTPLYYVNAGEADQPVWRAQHQDKNCAARWLVPCSALK
jgi:hypothetical protein